MNKSYLISNLYSGFYWKLGRPVSCNNVWEGSDWFKSLFWLLIRRKTKGRGRHVKRKYASCLHFRVFSAAASLYNKNNIAAKWVLHIYDKCIRAPQTITYKHTYTYVQHNSCCQTQLMRVTEFPSGNTHSLIYSIAKHFSVRACWMCLFKWWLCNLFIILK